MYLIAAEKKAENLVEAGALWFDTPADLAHHSEIVFTMIGFPKDVEEVYFGEQGIFNVIKKGTVLIDMTTTKPSLAVKIAKEAEKLGTESWALNGCRHLPGAPFSMRSGHGPGCRGGGAGCRWSCDGIPAGPR